jgi:outer membrane protein TolC
MNSAPFLTLVFLAAAAGQSPAETKPVPEKPTPEKAPAARSFLDMIGLDDMAINRKATLPDFPTPARPGPVKPNPAPVKPAAPVPVTPQIEPPLPDSPAAPAIASDLVANPPAAPAPDPTAPPEQPKPAAEPDADVAAAMEKAKSLIKPGDPVPTTPAPVESVPVTPAPNPVDPLISEPPPEGASAALMPDASPDSPAALQPKRTAPAVKVDPELTKQRADRVAEATGLSNEAIKAISAKTISLVDAVRLTLDANPMIKLGVLDAKQAENTLTGIQGAFDHRVTAQYDWRYQRTESKDKEKDKERARYAVTRELYKASGIILKRINEVAIGKRSPDDFDYSGTAYEDSNAALNNPPDAEPEDKSIFEQELLRDNNIKEIRSSINAILPKDEVDRINDLAVQAVLAQKKAFTLLRQQSLKGLIRNPPWITRKVETQKYELALLRRFRGGPEAKLYAKVNSSEDNFSTRGKDPRENRSAVGIQLSVNLAKMGIADPDYAQEKAQMQQLDAARELARTKVASEVLSTVFAYWQLAAAQEKLERLYLAELETLASTTLAKSLIGAEILPAVELAQVNARQLQAVAARFGAEIELATAQQALAVAMGFDPQKIDLAPFASDPLPGAVDQEALMALQTGALIRHTLQFHPNLVAYRYLDNSNLILSEQARRDLRPDFDLTAGGEFSGYNQQTGLDGALGVWGSHTIGPSVFLGGKMDWPLENRTREGAYANALNKLESTRLREDDVRRKLASQVALSHQKLRISSFQLEKLRSATQEAGNALSIERQKLRDGSGTATDVLTAEQNLTQFSLQEIGTRLMSATSLAELRYSTFTILPPFSYDRLANGGNFLVTQDNFVELPSASTMSRYHAQASIFTATEPMTSLERLGFGKPVPLFNKLGAAAGPQQVTYTGNQGQPVTVETEPIPRAATASPTPPPGQAAPRPNKFKAAAPGVKSVEKAKPKPATPAAVSDGKPKPLLKRLFRKE